MAAQNPAVETARTSVRKPRTTLTRWGNLSQVFPVYQAKVLHQNIARLCVLFEDLRIEIQGIAVRRIDELDVAGDKLRSIYFQRRSIGTLVEFAEGLRLLDQCPDFTTITARFDREQKRLWTTAVRFFGRQEHFFKQVRNDVGGHFGSTAAAYAVEHLQPEASGGIEVALFDHGGGGAKLFFAGEIAATALMHHLRGANVHEKSRHLIRLCLVGYKHAVRAVDCITISYLWDRFGK